MDVVVAVAATALLLALFRVSARAPGIKAKKGVVMRYPTVTIATFGVMFVGGSVALPLLFLLQKNQSRPAVLNGIIAFALVVTPLGMVFCATLRRRILISETEIVEFSKKPRRSLKWSELESVRYSSAWRRYILLQRDGKRLSVERDLRGQREFAQVLTDKVPVDRRVDAQQELNDVLEREQ